MYQSGELRDRVKVMRWQLTSDGMGGNDKSVAEAGEYWCHVRPMSGRETTDFDRVNPEATYLFVFRNGLDVTEDDYFLWDGEEFNIRVIKRPKNKRQFLEIEAERGVAL